MVLTQTDFDKLSALAQHYDLSRASMIRLALRELYQKINGKGQLVGLSDPLLNPVEGTVPEEVDDFWKTFRS